VRGITPPALELLLAYHWPGNVRELLNVIERAVSFAEGAEITPEDLPDYVRGQTSGGPRRIASTTAVAPQKAPEAAAADRPASEAEAAPAPAQTPHLDLTFKDAKERWVSTFERDYISYLLKKNNMNISHAAREADIDRKYFRKLMRKYEIASPAGEADDEE
jgi:DNA-binding NtrC family response regulator